MLKGFNGSILAYGQTGTGKTHTMEGFLFSQSEDINELNEDILSSKFLWVCYLSISEKKEW